MITQIKIFARHEFRNIYITIDDRDKCLIEDFIDGLDDKTKRILLQKINCLGEIKNIFGKENLFKKISGKNLVSELRHKTIRIFCFLYKNDILIMFDYVSDKKKQKLRPEEYQRLDAIAIEIKKPR